MMSRWELFVDDEAFLAIAQLAGINEGTDAGIRVAQPGNENPTGQDAQQSSIGHWSCASQPTPRSVPQGL